MSLSLRRRSLLAFCAHGCLWALVASPCAAVQRTWIGGNGTWVDGPANNAFWTGSDEPDPDDHAIFNSPNTVGMGSDNTVGFLTASAGIDLDTNGNSLTVTNGLDIIDTGTRVRVEVPNTTLAAGYVNVSNSGRLELLGGNVHLYHDFVSSSIEIVNHGELIGYGEVVHLPILSAQAVAVNNAGTISAYRAPLLPTLPPPPGTLTFNASDLALAKLDLDGHTNAGIVNVYRNQTLDINLPLWDAFSGEMNLYHNATLDMYQPWTMDNGAINIHSNSIAAVPPFPSIPAGTSYIAGGQMTQTGGVITILGDSTLQLNARLVMNGGSIVNAGTLRVNANDLYVNQNASLTLSSSAMETVSSSLLLNGQLNVSSGADSRIDVEANHFLQFNSNSHTVLDGNLRIHSNNANIYAGATFSGPGSLHVEENSNLSTRDGSDVHALVINDGTHSVGGYVTVGSASVSEYWQSETGMMDIDLGGVAPLQSDRLLVDGAALLDGDLRLRLDNGFVPSLADPLISIISASAGVTGLFDSIINPINMPAGLHYEAVYSPTLVQLKVVSSPLLPADFNHDGLLNCQDIDSLVAAIASGSQNGTFDLNGDGLVTTTDLNQWLTDAGAVNLPSGNPYPHGDANLDGVVDGSDFNLWNSNKFTATAAWCQGDFTADGVIDGSDFNTWNSHKFTSADSTSAVPEPACAWLTVLLGVVCLWRRRSR